MASVSQSAVPRKKSLQQLVALLVQNVLVLEDYDRIQRQAHSFIPLFRALPFEKQVELYMEYNENSPAFVVLAEDVDYLKKAADELEYEFEKAAQDIEEYRYRVMGW